MPESPSREVLDHMESPLQLSILIVTYNSKDTIKECLDSVFLACKDLQAEVVVVDNHSSDGTQELLGQLIPEYADLFLQMNKTNRGFAIGNNQALQLAQGEHIMILNPDTIVEPDTLIELLSALKADKTIGAVAPQLQFPDGSVQRTCRRFPVHRDVIYHVLGLASLFPQSPHFNGWKMGDFDHLTRQVVDQPAGAALLVRGHLLRALNGFDENFPMFFNDVDLCKRIWEAGYTIWYLPEHVIQHLGGASVKQVKMKMTISSHVSFFRYFEKHFTRMYQQPFNFIAGVLLYASLIPRLLVLLVFKSRQTQSRETL